MELGEKLLQARKEAGLSQRQLCGDTITRNMLSQIEHGTARPSMDTLKYLAGRLGKPVSYFLQEDVVTSPNRQVIIDAGNAYRQGDVPKARLLLENYDPEDPVFRWEYRYLHAMTTLSTAQKALAEGKDIYARVLLAGVEESCRQIPGAERQRLMLLGQIPGADLTAVCRKLPSLDEELLLRAREALRSGKATRAAQLLDAAEDQSDPKWNLLRGRVCIALEEYREALPHLHRAEAAYPAETAPALEQCYREIGDYKQAYEYACKQK